MKKNNVFLLITNPFLISLLLLFILIIISFKGNMGNDEGMWSYIGRIWIQNGIPPYVGAFENKTPGIFELHAFSYILFGVNIFFVRVLGVIFLLLSSLTVYYIGKELHSHLAGIFGMYIFGLTVTWNFLDGVYPAQTETFMVLFSTLSFYFIIKGKDSLKWEYWILLAGVSMGLAISFKQTALTTALALVYFFYVYPISNLTNQNKFLGFIFLGSGIVISTFLSLIPLFLSGVSLNEYFDGAWLSLLNPASSSSLKSHIYNFFRTWVDSRIVVFYPCLLLFLLQKDLIKNKYFVGLLVWLIADFIGVNSSGHYFGHQIKQLIPSLSIIIGILINNQLLRLDSLKASYEKYCSFVIITIIIIMFPYELSFLNVYKMVKGQSNPDKEIGTWLKSNTRKDEYIYIIGSQGNPILSYSERVSSSKYFNSIFISGETEIKILLSDLYEKPPVYILKPESPDLYENMKNLEDSNISSFMNNYTYIQRKYNWNIFKRN